MCRRMSYAKKQEEFEMKMMKKVSVFLLMLVLCMSVMVIPAFASSTSQDGLEVALTTDKETYDKGEQIEASLTVTNTNDYAVNNVLLKKMIPDGYKLAKGSTVTKQVESLAAGEKVSLTVRYVAEDSNNKEKPGNGDNASDVNKPGSGDKNNFSSKDDGSGIIGNATNNPHTGDDSSIALWVGLIVIAIIGIGIIILLKKKQGKRFLSLFLCFVMAGMLAPISTINVRAATVQRNIHLSQNVLIGTNQLTLNALITYDIDEEDGLKDSDNDGLIDVDEDEIKTDSMNPDTDGDGLSDYEEVILGTDPLTPNDYDKSLDSDSDGIVDIEEIKVYGTDPYNADTDSDGLSDYDEINVYGTNPTRNDTDEDTLSDGFEIQHGLNPNKASTDGVTNDGKVIIDQTISDDGISLTLRDKSNLAKPNISGKTFGELADNVFLSKGTDSAFDDMRSVIGRAVYVDGSNEYVNGLTLTFDLSSYEGSLENLMIAVLNDEGLFDIVDSILNENELSCQLEKSGTYCVLDLDEFLSGLDLDLSSYWNEGMESEVSTHSLLSEEDLSENANAIVCDDNYSDNLNEEVTGESSDDAEMTEENINQTSGDETSSVSLFSSSSDSGFYKAEVDEDLLTTLNETNKAMLSSTVSGQADIVFAIDTTGSMSSTINNVVTNVTSFATTLSDNYNVNVNYALIDFKDLEEDGAGTTTVIKNGSSNWFSNVNTFVNKVDTLVASGGGDSPECSVDALETARRLDFRTSASKFIILITDASYKEINDYGIVSMAEEIELLKADGVNTSVVTTSNYQDTYRSLYESTGGIYANISSSNFSSSLLELADLIGETTSDGTWVILKHGYRYVRLTDETDQDGDGLSTTYELGNEEEIDLTPFIKFLLSSHGVPFENYLGKTTIKVYDAKSDPTKDDTDNDGIIDKKDDAPWSIGLKDGIVGAIKICSYGDGAGSSAGISGHAYLAYTSFVTTDITLYGIKVNAIEETAKENDTRKDRPTDHTFSMKTDSVISIGGWAGWLPDDLKGSWINNELYLFQDNIPDDQTSLMKYITYNQMEQMESSVKAHSKWTMLYNCSAFAADVWNDTLDDNLSAKGPWASPKSLAYHIQKRSGYEIAAPMYSEWP